MQDRYFTDEELTAFLDGENDLAPVDDIAAALETDAALAKRVDALLIDRDAIAASFAGIAPTTKLPNLSAVAQPRAGFGAAALSIAAGIALVVGIAAGSWIAQPKPAGWVDYVAAYQVLYSNSTLAHIDQTPDAKQSELDRVTASIGKDIPLDALEGFPELDYKRAQILNFKGRALVQLAFATSTGEPLALCIIRSTKGQDTAPTVITKEGLSTAKWSSGTHDYLLIGGTDDALVSRIANELVTQEI